MASAKAKVTPNQVGSATDARDPRWLGVTDKNSRKAWEKCEARLALRKKISAKWPSQATRLDAAKDARPVL